MSKYKPLDEPITRREACLILDRKRFDAAVRFGDIVALGKRGADGVVTGKKAPLTSPLLFEQAAVRLLAVGAADTLAFEARVYREEAKAVAKKSPPMTRRQVAQVLGKKMTGVLIRSGRLAPYGTLTDTQTAAHTYNPVDVAEVMKALATEAAADAKLLRRSSKVRVPA